MKLAARNRPQGKGNLYILDPLLIPRLQQFSHSNDLLDVDATVNYLRRNYREYRRKQQVPFRKLVIQALQFLQLRPRTGLPRGGKGRLQRGDDVEIRLQQEEEEHARRFSQEERSGSSDQEEITSSGSEYSSEGSMDDRSRIGSDSGEQAEKLAREGISLGKRWAEGKAESAGEGRNYKRREVRKGIGVFVEAKGKKASVHGSDYGGDSDSEGFLDHSPNFNLLNSSLRTTYTGRPALVLEKSLLGKPSGMLSLTPAKDMAPNSESKNKTRLGTVGDKEETKKSQFFLSSPPEANKVEGDVATQAFAPPSVVAAAARAASRLGKKYSRLLDSSQASQGKSSVDNMDSKLELSTNSHNAGHGAREAASESNIERKCDVGDETMAVNNGRYKSADPQRTELEIQRGRSRDGEIVSSKKRGKRPDGRKGHDEGAAGVKSILPSTTAADPVRFSDLGGIDRVLGTVLEVIYPLLHPQIYPWLGLQPMRGILLHGPPGCGKTKLATAIANETGLPFLKISAPEVVSGMSGESEAKVRGLFAEASRLAPCVVFIDEIDAITSKRENAQREMERRIVTQLMTCMDELSQPCKGARVESELSIAGGERKGHVLVIGATNRPEVLDPALRRPGRFDREICVGVPDENGRAQILSVLARNLRLEGSFDFKRIARCTPGYVGADLAALTREAASIAIKRIIASRDPRVKSSLMLSLGCKETTSRASNRLGPEATSYDAEIPNEPPENSKVVTIANTLFSEKPASEVLQDEDAKVWWKLPWTQEEMQALAITMQDFENAVENVQPSAMREGFSAIPDVKWDDVGALNSVRRDLAFYISRRIKHPEDYQALGLDMDSGFLLYGPPGCGKTLVAKAVANDAQANFIFIKGPELLNKYVGESELSVRMLFSRARSCVPCILFFDEMDALAPRRGTDGNAVAERVLNQLLTEMDGAEKRKGVFLIAATNRPDMIDPAILRPGRLGKLLYVPLPDVQGRTSILKKLTRTKPISEDVNLISIAENKACDGLSGADLAALVNEACIAAMHEKIANEDEAMTEEIVKGEPLLVCSRHFDVALKQVSPSVSKQDLLYYKALPKKFNQTQLMNGIASEMYV